MERYVRQPIRVAVDTVTAPAAQRAYLTTFLFLAASLFLLCIAALGYPIFYYSYVPKKAVSLPVHLQYNAGLNPYGLVRLDSSLMLETAYDVSVELTLPRSPPNTERGNFMIAMYGMRSAPENPALSWTIPSDPYQQVDASTVVFSSRRPALVPYQDKLVSTASRMLFLLYYIFFPASEQIKLNIPMGELVEFTRELPLSLLVDVQAGQTLQVYEARVELIARLTGVRWAMYNYRILSFVVFTTLFWLAEMISMALAWLLLSSWLGPKRPARGAAGGVNGYGGYGGNGAGALVKQEELEVSKLGTDGSRPTTAGTGGTGASESVAGEAGEDEPGIKKEEEEEESKATTEPLTPGAEVDGEEEDGGRGTAFSPGESTELRRRPSQRSES